MRSRGLIPLVVVLGALVGLGLGAMLLSHGSDNAGPTPSPSASSASPTSPTPSQSTPPPTSPSASSTSPTSSPTPTRTTATPSQSPTRTSTPTPTPTGTGFVITRLKPGERPPQFVVVSFDGTCQVDQWGHYLSLARQVGAHFTFFLGGLCIVPTNKAYLYHPPNHPAGTSAIGFAPLSAIPDRISDLAAAYRAGQEIGTHFLGHFCDADGVDSWTSTQWRSELSQFNWFLNKWQQVTGLTGLAPLPFGSSAVRGDRTPCLGGQPKQYLPVFHSYGWVYDASRTGTLRWPTKLSVTGTNVGSPVAFTTPAASSIWEFPLQSIQVVGYGKTQLSMDYNFLVAQNNGVTTGTTAVCDRARTSTYQSYLKALEAVYHGNRAPFIVGNHFNTWLCGAYRDALTQFVTDVHKLHPDVKFVSFYELSRWLDAQDPSILAALYRKGTQPE